jgi:hypothetical protein
MTDNSTDVNMLGKTPQSDTPHQHMRHTHPGDSEPYVDAALIWVRYPRYSESDLYPCITPRPIQYWDAGYIRAATSSIQRIGAEQHAKQQRDR